MELVFRGHVYDTDVTTDMAALQRLLDAIDIRERMVKKNQEAALLKSKHARTN